MRDLRHRDQQERGEWEQSIKDDLQRLRDAIWQLVPPEKLDTILAQVERDLLGGHGLTDRAVHQSLQEAGGPVHELREVLGFRPLNENLTHFEMTKRQWHRPALVAAARNIRDKCAWRRTE